MVVTSRLLNELLSAGLPVEGAAAVLSQHPTDRVATWHQRSDGLVRVDWTAEPTGYEANLAEKVVMEHDGRPTFNEQLDTCHVPTCVMVALLLERPAIWAKLSDETQKQVAAILDRASAEILEDLLRAAPETPL